MTQHPIHSRQPHPQPEPTETTQAPVKRRQIWRFWAPLLVQIALVVAVPAQNAYTFMTGTTVVLQTVPVDPYDLLRGYSQTLSYQVSDLSQLRQLPGGDALAGEGTAGRFYLVLQAPDTAGSSEASSKRPTPWQPQRLRRERPRDLAANQVALQGWITQTGRVRYGLESYYLPEDQRQQINQTIAQTQRRDPQALVAEVKVDSRGQAVPVRLWVQDRPYRF